jgi:hypothetical protein
MLLRSIRYNNLVHGRGETARGFPPEHRPLTGRAEICSEPDRSVAVTAIDITAFASRANKRLVHTCSTGLIASVTKAPQPVATT